MSAQEISGIGPDSNSDTNNFKLYPNPSYNGAVHITTAHNKVKNIIVYDVFGAIVLKDRITTTFLNISKLSPGVYVLQVTEEQKVMTRKLVVK
ncbi:MAG TPA: T9SS type A sorting domain-containing protein [Arenibacter sp.]|nr:T9SS type A sorting domain-containing protein [Arenibacter sp.]